MPDSKRWSSALSIELKQVDIESIHDGQSEAYCGCEMNSVRTFQTMRPDQISCLLGDEPVDLTNQNVGILEEIPDLLF